MVTSDFAFAQWLVAKVCIAWGDDAADRAPGAKSYASLVRLGTRQQAGESPVNLPNIITLGRILLVPIIIWAIASNQMTIAFVIFVTAGVSDAIDGFLAKRFNMTTEIGALLDPVADKALLVSIYVALGIWGAMPRWLVILVVSRDFMIVGAVIVSWLLDNPVPMKPLMVSKLNTVAQVAFAALVLASLGFGFSASPYDTILMGFVTILTLLSVSFYLVEWARHMSTTGPLP
ncbi:cardiolipin synthase [Nitrobacteraceae bacterium AZCC 1564]